MQLNAVWSAAFNKVNLFCFALGLMTLLFLYAGFGYVKKNAADDLRHRYAERAKDTSIVIQACLDNIFSATHPLRAFIRNGMEAPNIIDAVIAETMRHTPAIKSVTITQPGKEVKIYPAGFVPQVKSSDLQEFEQQFQKHRLASHRRELILSNPYELPQGGFGLTARLVVNNTEGTAQSDDLLGYVDVVIDLTKALGYAQLDGQFYSDTAYQLSKLDADQKRRMVLAASKLGIPQEPEVVQFTVAQGYWSIAVAPEKGWLTPFTIGDFAIITVVAGLVSLLCYIVLRLRDDKRILEFYHTAFGDADRLSNIAKLEQVLSRANFTKSIVAVIFVHIETTVHVMDCCWEKSQANHEAIKQLLISSVRRKDNVMSLGQNLIMLVLSLPDERAAAGVLDKLKDRLRACKSTMPEALSMPVEIYVGMSLCKRKKGLMSRYVIAEAMRTLSQVKYFDADGVGFSKV